MYIKDANKQADQAAMENFELKGQRNLAFLEDDQRYLNTIRSADVGVGSGMTPNHLNNELRTHYSPCKRYNMRVNSPSIHTNYSKSLMPQTYRIPSPVEKYSESEKSVVKSSSDSKYKFLEYEESVSRRNLRNKQHIDRLYENGKQKMLSRSQSNFMSYKESKDLQECSFHPKVKNSYKINNPYHANTRNLVSELHKRPTRDKSMEYKYERDSKIAKECTFTPKVGRVSSGQNRSRSVFNQLYEDNHRRQKQKRKNESQQEPDDRELTFSPNINHNYDLETTPEKDKNAFKRLHQDFNKRKSRQIQREGRSHKGLTFIPKLVAKSVQRVIDSSDDEPLRTVHDRLYHKHFDKQKKHKYLRKRAETALTRPKPITSANAYLDKLKDLYRSGDKKSLMINIHTTQGDLKADQITDVGSKSYLENKDVHDRLYNNMETLENKQKLVTKRLDKERGIIFRPKITDYPIDESKRKPLYTPTSPKFKRSKAK